MGLSESDMPWRQNSASRNAKSLLGIKKTITEALLQFGYLYKISEVKAKTKRSLR